MSTKLWIGDKLYLVDEDVDDYLTQLLAINEQFQTENKSLTMAVEFANQLYKELKAKIVAEIKDRIARKSTYQGLPLVNFLEWIEENLPDEKGPMGVHTKSNKSKFKRPRKNKP